MSETSRQRARAWVALLCGACIVLGAAGCASAPMKSPLMEQAADLADLTAAQLRQQLYDFTSRHARVIERAADAIMQASGDAAVRERALLWKLQAIPEVNRAAFKSDPLVGLIDTVVLCGQMLEFFRDGAGLNLFGKHQNIAPMPVSEREGEIPQQSALAVIDGERVGTGVPDLDLRVVHPDAETHMAREVPLDQEPRVQEVQL